MPNKQNKKNSTSHVYRGCRDAIQSNVPGTAPGTTGVTVTSGATGNANYAGVLCPLGLTSVVYSAGAFIQPTPANGNILPPTLRGLFNKAIGFQMYRVTRAKLVFVGAVSTNSTGSVSMSGYSDPIDVNTIAYAPFSSGPNTRVFSLASAGGKELSVPIPVDSSWKKVSGTLTTVGNVYPFNATSASTFVTVASAADLSFGAWAVYVYGCAASTTLGSLYIDYDVEFKLPIDTATNF